MIFYVIISSLYVLFLIVSVMALVSYKKVNDLPTFKNRLFVSLIIPLRNEEKRIGALLESLKSLKYGNDDFEVLFVDDYSTDQSVQVIESFLKTNERSNWRVILKNRELETKGKKASITEGITNAKGDVIFTTDADCVLPPGILNLLNVAFQNEEIQMMAGPVMYHQKTFWSRLQDLEQKMLVGVAAVSLKLNLPSMCNGANLAYRTTAFETVNGFEGNELIPSGDDEFLMHKVFKKFGSKSVRYHFGADSSVLTEPSYSLDEFANQRKRWASKWRFYESFRSKILPAFIFLFHLTQLTVLVGVFLGFSWKVVAFLFMIKSLLELVFASRTNGLVGGRLSLMSFLVMTFGYSFYVVFFGLFGTFGGYTWRGRSYK